ncbi:HAD hydrolase-like protein [Candidatus Woesearchaeota archaeon]|nr:HAD hydrolase-like protein [Candidatus Woesearchaeota archaeon]
MLEGVIAVGFDLDGTLYKSTPEMNDRIRNKIAERILEKKPELKSAERAREFFEERYKEFRSGNRVLADVGYENSRKIMDDCIINTDVIDLISADPELARIMHAIRDKYDFIYLITSSPEKSANEKLCKIGISPKIFNDFMFGDEGLNKDDGSAFKEMIRCMPYVKPYRHIYVGDKLSSDILPAKKIGMRTAAVWFPIPEADYSLNHIHDIGGLLL